ncbi:O-antigen ligase family protein [Neptunitalea chrysea]|nr:O-antigen ligase family protein [Neptunitalea chrysea]
MIPFHDKVPYGFQFNIWRSQFMTILLLPFAAINVLDKDPKALRLFTRVLIIAIAVAIGYSFFLTKMRGFNPYIMAIFSMSGREFDQEYFMAEGGGRVFGRISGVFDHPMTNGLFLSFSLLFLMTKVNFNKLFKNKLLIFFILVNFICIVIIGVRSAIVGLGFGLVMFLLKERKFNVMFAGLFGLVLVLIILSQIPGMEDFTKSIVDPESSNVKGSSLDMRTVQFEGCIDEIQNNFLFGNGFAWTSYYRLNFGTHPTMLAFESLIIMVLCNSGFIGLVLWGVMIFKYLKLVNRKIRLASHKSVLYAFMASYIGYSTITGEYGYLKYFLIFYSLIYMQNIKNISKI